MIFGLFRKDPRRPLIDGLYARVGDAARREGLFAVLGVPDTLEGRFEALALHMVLAIRALRGRPGPADEVAQDLTNAFFRDLDRALREMGVGDTGVPKRMRTLGEAYYGRARAYDPLLDAGDEAALAEALSRNVYGGERPAAPLARYALAAAAALAGQSLDGLLGPGPSFPDPASFAEEAP